MIQKLKSLLSQYKFTFGNEREFQEQFEQLLTEEGIPFAREFELSRQDRPDFMVGELAIDLKIGGNLQSHLRQIRRYAAHAAVLETLLVSTRPYVMPEMLNGKPCHCIAVWTAML